MNKEELAKKIHWSWIIWMAGIVNVVAMLPQLIKIIKTQDVHGLSFEMFVIYLFVQVAFSLEGYFSRNRMLMICLGLSALVSITIITCIIILP